MEYTLTKDEEVILSGGCYKRSQKSQLLIGIIIALLYVAVMIIIIGSAIGFKEMMEIPMTLVINIVMAIFIVAFFVFMNLYRKSFNYVLTNKQIMIESGIFNKHLRTLDLRSISGVDKKQIFAFKYAVNLDFQSASISGNGFNGAHSKFIIYGVVNEDANKIIEVVNNYKNQ